jgi:hypothetical protein
VNGTATWRKSLAILLLVVLAGPAAADRVYLHGGKHVDGKIEKLEPDRLHLRTASGLVEYTRDQILYFSIVYKGPDGKLHVARRTFKPEPLRMPDELETPHYIIKTDTGDHVCKNAGRAMEHLYSAYTAIFNVEEDPKRAKAEIVIFEKKADFQKYARSLHAKPRKDTLGFYRMDPRGRDQIVTYKRRTDEFHTLSTLYHEATHQFLMKWMGPKNKPPLWLNEGLAVYFENSEWRGGRLRTGIIPRARLLYLQKALRAGKYVPLADLITRGRDKYDGLCYSEGWSLVYFFVKARRGAYVKRFKKYVYALRDGMEHDEAFRTCLTDKLDGLEKAWKHFCLRLKPTDR